jgi:hypothetical protein
MNDAHAIRNPAGLPPGSWLGMLGGGQLGRMAVHMPRSSSVTAWPCWTPTSTARPGPRPTNTCARPTRSRAGAAAAGLALRSGQHRVRERSGARAGETGAPSIRGPIGRRGGGLPGPRRREGALRPQRRALRAPRGAEHGGRLRRRVRSAAARHPEDRHAGLRRQGPAPRRQPRAVAGCVCGTGRRALRAGAVAAAGGRDQRGAGARTRRRHQPAAGAAQLA